MPRSSAVSLLPTLAALLLLAAAAFFPPPALCDGDRPSGEPRASEEPEAAEEDDAAGVLRMLGGRPARDALLLGMWSLHMDGSGELLGKGKNNEENHLLGLQLAGWTAGTFINSHRRRSFFGGLAREVYSRDVADDLRFDLGYKAGLMSGYDPELPNFEGVTAFIAAFAGFSWRRLGFDLGVTPLGVWTFSFRLDLDGWTRGP